MLNASARCVQFRASGQIYPGFESFSGSYDTISQSGLVLFNATVEISYHPDNPQVIDTRINLSTWSWCKEVELRVADDSGVLTVPRCIPKLYIKSAKYDPVNEKLRLELTDILGIKEPLSEDDFKRDFDDEDAIEEDKIERLEPCTFPDEDVDDPQESQEPEIDKADWWRQWEYDGFANNNEIIKEIFTRLKMSSTGSLSGRVKCPYTISGSFIGACGSLAFNSFKPSYLWSDWKGVVHIEPIRIDSPPRHNFSSTEGLLSFESVGVGNFISELVVTGRESRLKEVEQDENLERQSDGSVIFKTVTTQMIPDNMFSSSTSPLSQLIVGSTLTTTEEIRNNTKISVKKLEIRYGLLFPDSVWGNDMNMVIGEYSAEIQTFDECNGRLVKKEVVKWEPWGKIYNAFYNNFLGDAQPHISLSVSNFPYPPELSGAFMGLGAGSVSNLPMYAITSPQLSFSRQEITHYTYNETVGKLSKKETIVREPAMKIMSSYLPPVDEISVSEAHTEEWKEWGANHQIHIKVSMKAFETLYPEQVQKKESLLRGEGTMPTIFLTGSVIEDSQFSDTGKLISMNEVLSTIELPMRFVLPKFRLALTIDETITEHSRGGTSNAPNPEYLPRNPKQTGGLSSRKKTDRQKEEWDFKPVSWRVKWDNASNWGCIPPREIFNVGDVVDKNILGRVGQVVFALRQAQAQTYQTTLPIYQNWITDNGFKPCDRFDISECYDNAFAYFGNGYGFEFSRTEALMLVELWFLGRGRASQHTPVTIQSMQINFLPNTETGVFYLGGGGGSGGTPGQAVFVGQSLTPTQMQNLVFVPGSSFSGFTGLSYIPTTSDNQTHTTSVPIAVVDPLVPMSSLPSDTQLVVNDVNVPLAGVSTGEIGIVVGESVQYVTPSITYTINQISPGVYPAMIETPPVENLEANGFVEPSGGFIDFAIIPRTVLQRTYMNGNERTMLERSVRLTSLYR